MARRQRRDEIESRGISEIIGIILLGISFLLLVALYSFDPYDLPSNRIPTNDHTNNWIGLVGAYLANACFFLLGMAGYLVPVMLLGLGLGFVFTFFTHLRSRWPWALLLVLSCSGLFDLYSKPLNAILGGAILQNLNIPTAGGGIGMVLNQYIIERYFGRVGATTIFSILYLISLIGLTNIRIGPWIHYWWLTRSIKMASIPVINPMDERALEKRAKELAKQAKKLQEQVENVEKETEPKEAVERTGLGADLKPVPEPTIRDLSIPQPNGRAKSVNKPVADEKVDEPLKKVVDSAELNEPITKAASTEDILGKNSALKSSEAGSAAKQEFKEKSEEDELPDIKPSLPKPKFAPKKPKPLSVASTPLIGNYKLPSFDLLHFPDTSVKPTETKEDLISNARLMQNTLAQFDIEVALGDITKGPTITRYELHPAPGVRLEKIVALTNNIAAALKAENVSVLAPIPGKSSVGIEVPNHIKTKVIMRDLLESEEWQRTKARIPLALGKDVYGHPMIADLAEMPHLLIAGSTGSGKSVCINSIIASLLYRFPPDQLRFVMIDPKVVELQHYNALPHLVVPVVTDPKKVVLALRWVVNEMEKRYQIFARVGVRNIKSFNERPKNKPVPQSQQPELPLTSKKERIEASSDGFAVELDEEIVVPRDEDIVIPDKLSYIVVIIDELADLMLVAPADVEMAIARITQMARAAGIHCIVATQRPSVDVITGVIKANIPARIAFQVAAKVDSRTILDAMGADKLLGKGDMLFLPPGSSRLIRAQGALITDQEIQSIVDSIAVQGKPSYEIDIHQQLSQRTESLDSDNGCDEDESLIEQCIEVIRSEQKASVSLLQRRLRLGYTRAARIMDELENRGIVGPNKGAEPRDILIDLDGDIPSNEPPEKQI